MGLKRVVPLVHGKRRRVPKPQLALQVTPTHEELAGGSDHCSVAPTRHYALHLAEYRVGKRREETKGNKSFIPAQQSVVSKP